MVVVISLAGFLRRTLLFSVFEGCYLLHIKLLWTPCQSRPAKLLVVQLYTQFCRWLGDGSQPLANRVAGFWRHHIASMPLLFLTRSIDSVLLILDSTSCAGYLNHCWLNLVQTADERQTANVDPRQTTVQGQGSARGSQVSLHESKSWYPGFRGKGNHGFWMLLKHHHSSHMDLYSVLFCPRKQLPTHVAFIYLLHRVSATADRRFKETISFLKFWSMVLSICTAQWMGPVGHHVMDLCSAVLPGCVVSGHGLV